MVDFEPPVDRAEFYKAYEEYARNLRAWFVAYGVGGPVLILTQEHVSKAVIASGAGPGIARLFLSGVGLQILLSLINKWANWGVYAYSESQALADGRLFGFWSAVTNQVWIDILLDLGSVACFALATWKFIALFT